MRLILQVLGGFWLGVGILSLLLTVATFIGGVQGNQGLVFAEDLVMGERLAPSHIAFIREGQVYDYGCGTFLVASTLALLAGGGLARLGRR